MSLTVAEDLRAPSPTLVELGLETHMADASDLIVGAFALEVFADLTYIGDTKPTEVRDALRIIANEARNVAEHPTSKFGRRELWIELDEHTRDSGLDITAS